MKKDKKLTILVTEETHALLNKIAKAEYRSMAQTITHLIHKEAERLNIKVKEEDKKVEKNYNN
ncbi:MAG: hypothetical protein Q4B43_00215 [Bacteroidota bacterium]|nr:hypothetical protein [Bacteroidota bacterium]